MPICLKMCTLSASSLTLDNHRWSCLLRRLRWRICRPDSRGEVALAVFLRLRKWQAPINRNRWSWKTCFDPVRRQLIRHSRLARYWERKDANMSPCLLFREVEGRASQLLADFATAQGKQPPLGQQDAADQACLLPFRSRPKAICPETPVAIPLAGTKEHACDARTTDRFGWNI
jgi:hypothetical protein